MLYYNTKTNTLTDLTKFLQFSILITLSGIGIVGLTENGSRLLIEEFKTEEEAKTGLMIISRYLGGRLSTDKTLKEEIKEEQKAVYRNQ